MIALMHLATLDQRRGHITAGQLIKPTIRRYSVSAAHDPPHTSSCGIGFDNALAFVESILTEPGVGLTMCRNIGPINTFPGIL